MGWLTKSYNYWIKKTHTKKCKKNFDKYLNGVFKNMQLKNVILIAFYEIHLISEKLGRLSK